MSRHDYKIAQRVKVQLATAGLELTMLAIQEPTRHTLLRPVGLRVIESDEHIWDRIELIDLEPSATVQCVWQFLELVNAPLESFTRFIERWGLFDFGQDAVYMAVDEEASKWVGEWDPSPRQVFSLLTALAATESGELVGEDVLDDLRAGDDYAPNVIAELIDKGPLPSLQELGALELEKRRDRWRVIRESGQGIPLQRSLVTRLMAHWAYPVEFDFHWDNSGRRMETVARGVKEIIAAHLVPIFSAGDLDIFVCSVCGRPYPLGSGQRRPRRGSRSLCSSACRQVAKREDDLASWHRNKVRWTKGSSTNPKRRKRHGPTS